jgi:hypothetical protein
MKTERLASPHLFRQRTWRALASAANGRRPPLKRSGEAGAGETIPAIGPQQGDPPRIRLGANVVSVTDGPGRMKTVTLSLVICDAA